MKIELGYTEELVNTQYAPLAVLLAHYQQNQVWQPLTQVTIPLKTYDFTPEIKLMQIWCSILAGCQTMTEVNSKLKQERFLAQAGGWSRFADQSTLSRTLNGLTLMNMDQLREALTQITKPISQTRQHDWRGFLWLDFDLSALTCGPQAEGAQKGYMGGKKTKLVAN